MQVHHAESAETIALRNLMTPELRHDLERALAMLSERQRDIFYSHFIDEVSYADLGVRWGIDKKRARAIANIAKSHLRSVTSLRQYLDMI